MAISQTHQYLSADALLGLLRSGFAALPEPRAGTPSLALPDVLMSAFGEILDPVEPEGLRPLFTHIFGAPHRRKALEKMVFVAGHSLLAFDGTGSFSSQQMHCDAR